MVSIDVPGPKFPVIPFFSNSSLSSSGIIPPPIIAISFAPFSSKYFFTSGNAVKWAPLCKLNAIASTSSSIAILATCSGVGSNPLYITSIPASLNALHKTKTPLSCASNPGFATNILIFLDIL